MYSNLVQEPQQVVYGDVPLTLPLETMASAERGALSRAWQNYDPTFPIAQQHGYEEVNPSPFNQAMEMNFPSFAQGAVDPDSNEVTPVGMPSANRVANADAVNDRTCHAAGGMWDHAGGKCNLPWRQTGFFNLNGGGGRSGKAYNDLEVDSPFTETGLLGLGSSPAQRAMQAIRGVTRLQYKRKKKTLLGGAFDFGLDGLLGLGLTAAQQRNQAAAAARQQVKSSGGTAAQATAAAKQARVNVAPAPTTTTATSTTKAPKPQTAAQINAANKKACTAGGGKWDAKLLSCGQSAAQTACSTNQDTWTNGQCVNSAQHTACLAVPGSTWANGVCTPPPPSAAANACTGSGGTWANNACGACPTGYTVVGGVCTASTTTPPPGAAGCPPTSQSAYQSQVQSCQAQYGQWMPGPPDVNGCPTGTCQPGYGATSPYGQPSPYGTPSLPPPTSPYLPSSGGGGGGGMIPDSSGGGGGMTQAAPTAFTSAQAMPDSSGDFAQPSPDGDGTTDPDAIVAAATGDADSGSSDQSMMGLGSLLGLGCSACNVAMGEIRKSAAMAPKMIMPQAPQNQQWSGAMLLGTLALIGVAGYWAYSQTKK